MADKNAARHLYELMREWWMTPAGVSVLQHRSDPEQDQLTAGDSWWPIHAQAVAWLNELDAQLERLRQLDPDQHVPFAGESLDRLRRAVFSVNTTMDAPVNGDRQHLSRDDLNALHLLSLAWKADMPANPGAATEILEATREIQDLVIAATDMDPKMRDYIVDLAHGLQRAVTEVAVHGTGDVQRLADQLVGVLLRYMSMIPASERAASEGAIQKIVSNVKIFLGLVPPTVKAIEAADSLFGTHALPPGS